MLDYLFSVCRAIDADSRVEFVDVEACELGQEDLAVCDVVLWVRAVPYGREGGSFESLDAQGEGVVELFCLLAGVFEELGAYFYVLGIEVNPVHFVAA